MERRDEDCKNTTPFQNYDVKIVYISITVTFNLFFGSLFYYYSINTVNEECNALR